MLNPSIAKLFAFAAAVIMPGSFAVNRCNLAVSLLPYRVGYWAIQQEESRRTSEISTPGGPPTAETVKELVAKIVQCINQNDSKTLESLYSDDMRNTISESTTASIIQSVITRRGRLLKVNETVQFDYGATVHLTAERGDWDLNLTFGGPGLLESMMFDGSKYLIPLPVRNSTTIRLPFSGRWKVTAAGSSRKTNHHANGRADSIHAVDFAFIDAAGRTQSDSATLGLSSDKQFSFGREVLAVADGVVETVIDGVPDNVGTADLVNAGNTIVIRHSANEVSVYVHLKAYSSRVTKGERVKAHQVIGLCGNSGASAFSHLHFHMCNSPVGQLARGFPAFFENVRVTRGGKTSVHEQYLPVYGDIVEQVE